MKNLSLQDIRAQTQERLHDPERLNLMELLDLLGTESVEALDRMTQLASKIINAPISLVSLLDADRQLFKGMFGLPEPVASERFTPLSSSFCQYVVGTEEPLITNDARQHPLLQDNLAIKDLDVIAYLGIPLRVHDGPTLGSFCVIDTKPREWTDNEIEIMRELANAVMTELELRTEIAEHKRSEEMNLQLRLEIERREMLNLFMQDFSHEFRTALSSISSKAYMLHRNEDTAQKDRLYQQIEQNVQAVTRLIESMKLLTQIDNMDTGQLRATARLTECLQYASEKLADRAEQKSVTIQLDIPAEIPLVKGDQQYITTAIEQLVSNAITFSSEGGTVEITAITGADETSVDIINHGNHIPEEVQKYIFQLFYREDPARTERGLGLGLPIAKRIMERYQGTLELVRSDTISTVFRMTFSNETIK